MPTLRRSIIHMARQTPSWPPEDACPYCVGADGKPHFLFIGGQCGEEVNITMKEGAILDPHLDPHLGVHAGSRGFRCTRLKGHIGPHIACSMDPHQLLFWTDERLWNKDVEVIREPNAEQTALNESLMRREEDDVYDEDSCRDEENDQQGG